MRFSGFASRGGYLISFTTYLRLIASFFREKKIALALKNNDENANARAEKILGQAYLFTIKWRTKGCRSSKRI